MSETINALPDGQGERRQLTVVFCDLVDSTGLSMRLDPEDLRDVLDAYFATCNGVVEAFGGQVVDQIGDGIVAQFGFPVAQEDAAEIAVRAALAIAPALTPLRARVATDFNETIAVRIGVSTGLVVIGPTGGGLLRRVGVPIGETPNLAARLQTLAAPNTVVVGETTERLIRGRFALKALGEATLRGLPRPIGVFAVIGEKLPGDRFSARTIDDLLPIIERGEELGRLTAAADLAFSGRGQVAILLGEAGIGKSRLARELSRLPPACNFQRVVLHGSLQYQNVAFHPIIEHIERLAAVRRGDGTTENRSRLATILADRGIGTTETRATLSDLLFPSAEDAPTQIAEDGPARRVRLHRTLVAILLEAAELRPLLLIFEDAHWLDPSTLEVIERAAAVIAGSRVLLVLTSREVPRLAIASDAAVTQIVLDRLTEAGSALLATALAGEHQLPSLILRKIAAQSDGVPLFAEELTRAALETGDLGDGLPAPSDGGVPASLYDSLMTRLDRLGDCKRVAQLAATLGRRFRADVLLAIGEEFDAGISGALQRLTASGVVQPLRTQSVYAFRHALLRDVAYQSMLRRDRRLIHGIIARTIEARFPDITENEPDYLAQHFSQASECKAAFGCWLKAARQSILRSANREAISQLKAALTELDGIATGRQRDIMELEAQTALLGPIMAVLGYGHPEFAAIGRRAFELCQKLDCGAQVFPVLYSRWSHSWVIGDLHEAYRIAHEFLALAEQQELPGPRVVGHRLCGSSLTSIGTPVAAQAQLERAIALYDIERDRALAFVYGSDVRVVSQCHLAIACWLTGDLERAASLGERALEEAKFLDHANTLGYAVSYFCMLHVLRRNGPLVEAMASRMLAVSMERELPFWGSVAGGFLGWSAIQAGRVEHGIDALQRTLAFARTANMVQWMPNCLGWLAEGYGAIGETARGHACLEEASAIMQRGGEAWWEPERWRLSGELLLREGRFAAAQQCLETAVSEARRRDERSLELRAMVSLVRHLMINDRHDEARTRLAGAMAWFRTTRPGADQLEAQGLLQTIAGAT